MYTSCMPSSLLRLFFLFISPWHDENGKVRTLDRDSRPMPITSQGLLFLVHQSTQENLQQQELSREAAATSTEAATVTMAACTYTTRNSFLSAKEVKNSIAETSGSRVPLCSFFSLFQLNSLVACNHAAHATRSTDFQ